MKLNHHPMYQQGFEKVSVSRSDVITAAPSESVFRRDESEPTINETYSRLIRAYVSSIAGVQRTQSSGPSLGREGLGGFEASEGLGGFEASEGLGGFEALEGLGGFEST